MQEDTSLYIPIDFTDDHSNPQKYKKDHTDFD